MKKRINFTRSVIDALAGPTGTSAYVFYNDEKVDALTMRVSRQGTKHFIYYKKILGRPVRLAIGPYPDLSIEQARNRATEINATIARGDDPTQAKREGQLVPTLGSAFETYIDEYAKSHCKTWEVMVYCFGRYLGQWREKRLDSISKSDVQALVNRLGRENGRATANRTFELLRAVINRAKSLDIYTGQNPADGVAKFKLQARDRFLQSDELPRLFASLEEEKPLIRHFIYMCLLTGARRSNVAAMRWEEINFGAKTWRMPDSKNGQPHTVPLVPKAMEILLEREQCLAKTDWVFPGTGKTGHLVSPKDAWLRIKKRARLENVHLHDLRRTLGSWQAATGASLHVIGKTLNHKDPNTTAIYARLNLDPVRQAMETATNALLATNDDLAQPFTEQDRLKNVLRFRHRKTSEY